MLGRVPSHVLQQFTDLGAVQYCVLVLPKQNPYSGSQQLALYPDLIHFWDDRDREIGYWSTINPDNPVILAPNYRHWHPDIKHQHTFYPLPKQPVENQTEQSTD